MLVILFHLFVYISFYTKPTWDFLVIVISLVLLLFFLQFS